MLGRFRKAFPENGNLYPNVNVTMVFSHLLFLEMFRKMVWRAGGANPAAKGVGMGLGRVSGGRAGGAGSGLRALMRACGVLGSGMLCRCTVIVRISQTLVMELR